jgi:hypothetical protein
LFSTTMLMRRLVEGHRRREAHHAQHFALGQTVRDELAARCVGAVGRKLPVAVAPLAPRIGRGVGVPGQGDPVVDLVQHPRDLAQDVARVRLQLGAPDGEHGPILRVDDLYS